MHWWPVILFAMALNIDAFGVGLTYGMRCVLVPWYSRLWICIASGTAILISMGLGAVIASFVPGSWTHRLGGLLLVIVGTASIFQGLIRRRVKGKESDKDGRLFSLRLAGLGIILEVFRDPNRADLDSSGSINSSEAVLLGIALAMDALAAGFGAAVTGFNIFLTAFTVAFGQYFLLSAGLRLGVMLPNDNVKFAGSLTTGFVLITLGLLRI